MRHGNFKFNGPGGELRLKFSQPPHNTQGLVRIPTSAVVTRCASSGCIPRVIAASEVHAVLATFHEDTLGYACRHEWDFSMPETSYLVVHSGQQAREPSRGTESESSS